MRIIYFISVIVLIACSSHINDDKKKSESRDKKVISKSPVKNEDSPKEVFGEYIKDTVLNIKGSKVSLKIWQLLPREIDEYSEGKFEIIMNDSIVHSVNLNTMSSFHFIGASVINCLTDGDILLVSYKILGMGEDSGLLDNVIIDNNRNPEFNISREDRVMLGKGKLIKLPFLIDEQGKCFEQIVELLKLNYDQSAKVKY